jgi:hypothetical protein
MVNKTGGENRSTSLIQNSGNGDVDDDDVASDNSAVIINDSVVDTDRDEKSLKIIQREGNGERIRCIDNKSKANPSASLYH